MTLPDPGNRVGIRRIEQIEVRLDRVAIVDLELFRYPLIPDLHERQPEDLPFGDDGLCAPQRIAETNLAPDSVVAWIGAEMEFALSQAVASGDTFEHRPSECGHCVQDFLADLDLRDLPGEAAGSESGADDALPPADLRFYPAALVVPCGHLPGHAAVAKMCQS